VGTYLELRKRAKPQDEGDDGPKELSHVELVSDTPPGEHTFSKQYVDQAVAEGWVEYAGSPMSYTVEPDPLGDFRDSGPLALTVPGDVLVLHLVKDDVPLDVRYRIVDPPCPRGFRVADSDEPSGFRASNDFGLELEEA